MATTNIGALLLSELQALSTEARRKHPEIKEAAERVIVILRGIKATRSAEIAEELAKSDEAVSPFVMGCKTNNHKLASMSVQCLQQLISHRAVSPRSISQIFSTLNGVINLGVDIQVKILQMVLPLVTMYDGCVYGETLVEAFHLCLALQKSRDPVVNNTAAAILRQVVVAVFDRVVAEDREYSDDGDEQSDTRESDLTRKCAKDAFFVLQDLCLWAADSDSIFIRTETVDQGLVLDLIESVLVNHAAVVAQHTALLQILRERLAPFIVNFFAEKAPFTLAVRCIRIVWLIIRDLHTALMPECEMLLSILTRLVDPGRTGKSGRTSVTLPRSAGMQPSKTVLGSGFPLFYRVLAMEILRNVLRDAPLLHRLYAQFDGHEKADDGAEDCHVIADVLKAVGKVAAERPELRTSNSDGIPGALPAGASASDGGENADNKQVGAHNCSLRTEMHKLLDKHEPPLMPEPYLAYLAFTAMIGVADGLAEHMLPLCTENVACGAPATNRTPGSVLSPALALALTDARVLTVKRLMQRSWPVLLSVYNFYLVVRLDDVLFRQILDTMQKLVQVSGAFGLGEARDGFLLLLCRSCLPQAAIADHERQLQQGYARSTAALSTVDESALEGGAEPAKAQAALPLVTTSLAGVSFTMNARQVDCLRAVVACAQYLAGVLGPMWYPVLVTLQQGEELLYQSHGMASATAGPGNSSSSVAAKSGPQPAGAARRASVSNQAGSTAGSDEVKQLLSSSSDLTQIRSDYARLLGFVRTCGDDAIMWAVRAMCVLGIDLSNVSPDEELQTEEAAMRATASIIHRRLSAVLNRPTFAIDQLRAFAVGNVDLLVGASTDGLDGLGAWRVITRHLLATATHPCAPAPMRTQACGAVSDIVLEAMDLVSQADTGSAEETQMSQKFVDSVASGEAQVSVLAPLLQMMRGTAGDGFAEGARFVDVSKLTLDTVHRLLQASGRSIMRAWGVVFDIIHSVLEKPPAAAAATTAAGTESRQPGYLMRCVFPCLQLICSDYLEDLPPHCLRRCIECLALFGRQNEDLNIALTAIGQAWALCDFLQGLQAADAIEGVEPELISTVLPASCHQDTSAAIGAIAEGWWHEELSGLSSRRTQQVLWILLLHSLAQLGCDRRHEVRLGAIQTLFRTLDMRGDAFDVWLWDAVVWAVVLPLARYALTQRAHVFSLVREQRLNELLEDAQDEAARMASKSGVVVEDPGRLYGKQWDETAATALQGAARVWSGPRAAVDGIGCADQAWQCIWQLVQAFFVGEPADAICECLPDPQCVLDLQVPEDFVLSLVASESAGPAEPTEPARAAEDSEPTPTDEPVDAAAVQRAQLRTRDSMSAAIECASALVSSEQPAAETKWRIGWRAWLAMGALATLVPASAGRTFNEDGHGAVVVTQEALCAYLRLGPTIANALRGRGWFTETDAQALLHLARVVLMHVEIVLHSADDCKMTAVQAQVLDVVQLILEGDAGGRLDPAAATALVAGNLAMLAVLPYVVREPHGVLGSSAVARATAAAFAPMARRLDTLYPESGEPVERKHARRAVRPTFVALATSALGCLGSVLSELTSDDHLARVLRSGVWQDAIVAMGMHMVAPLVPAEDSGASDWFVRVVPSGMIRLRTVGAQAGGVGGVCKAVDTQASSVDGMCKAVDIQASGVGGVCKAVDTQASGVDSMCDALAAAWGAVGSVLALTMDIPQEMLELCNECCSSSERPGRDEAFRGLSAAMQIRILDAIAAASLQYVAVEDAADAEQPAEIAAYWPVLVRILEWGAVLAAEPVVLLGADGGTDMQALTMACFAWLFRMAAVDGSADISEGFSADSNVGFSTDNNIEASKSDTTVGGIGDTGADVKAGVGAKPARAMPGWVSAAAAPALVRRSAMALDAFVSDRGLVGKSPLPQSRIQLVRLVLQGLAQLQCHPGALAGVAGSELAQRAASSTAAHVFALYGSLVSLVAVPDAAVLPLVQRCLQRVSVEIFG
ncbi:Endocytosis and vacuole integrity protein [Coemansia sp. RSA 2618]|nr:Endocytosis and vacuole integrity protein [Coemansia sp. RSA 2618]